MIITSTKNEQNWIVFLDSSRKIGVEAMLYIYIYIIFIKLFINKNFIVLILFCSKAYSSRYWFGVILKFWTEYLARKQKKVDTLHQSTPIIFIITPNKYTRGSLNYLDLNVFVMIIYRRAGLLKNFKFVLLSRKILSYKSLLLYCLLHPSNRSIVLHPNIPWE